MVVVVAVIAFAGALVAAIGTGVLVSRIGGERRGWLMAWTVTSAALCLGLGAVAIGHLTGFGVLTFRIFQIAAGYLAPVWLAAGLLEVLSTTVAARFATRLIAISYTVVALVILCADAVQRATEFGKEMPDPAQHWDWPPEYVLLAAHAVVALTLLGTLIPAITRWRGGDEYDADNLHAALAVVPTGLGLVAAVHFQLPGVVAVPLIALSAGSVWYAVARPLAPYDEDDEDDEDEDDWEEPRPAGRRRRDADPARPAETHVGAAPGERRVPPHADIPVAGPSVGTGLTTGPTPVAGEGAPGVRSPFDEPERVPGRRPAPFPGDEAAAEHRQESPFPEPPVPDPPFPEPPFPEPPVHGPQEPPVYGGPPQEPLPYAGQGTGAHAVNGRHGTGPTPALGVPVAGPSALHGLITVLTLLDGTGEAFDRLADETVEAVRLHEPDTLIYTTHGVKGAPLQRIVYEIYRDAVAYEDHQRQPHIRRFEQERASYVLATNVIELELHAAKVLPLPAAALGAPIAGFER
ncbi:putative quinol monooxygenase [Bailinhaonella thermotolerans]|nr:hypothetical protein [Bailinhaonella thermotolerans]